MDGKRVKRASFNIDPKVAHDRSVIGGRSRTTNDYFVRKIIERGATLTADQKARLAELLMPFITAAGSPGGGGGESA